jgi:hypothetical protein
MEREMAGDPNEGADAQDMAEIFDETNITRDGEDIAHPDMARDVYDVTRAAGDADEDEADVDDFDPDAMDEAELEAMTEADDGIDEARSFAADDADRVASDDIRAADLEADDLSDEDIEALGYDDARKPPDHDPHVEKQLDDGLKETFPASDPVSINPGAD